MCIRDRNYIKSAYHKLSLIALLEDNIEEKKYYERMVLNNGERLIDEDRQAEYDVKNNTLVNTNLLKSRLLFDGGYYQEALDLLCPSVEKLARSLYTYADWGVGYNTAIVHVRKRFFKVIPESTSSEVVAQIEAELENEVEYILISHNEKRGINEVINTTTESCYSTFDKNI